MPELPEVETVKRTLEKHLIGKTISQVRIFTHKMIQVGDAKISNIKTASPKNSKDFVRVLAGKRVVSLGRRAKYLIIRLSESYELLIHLRMSGQLIYREHHSRTVPLFLSLAKTAVKETLPAKHTHVEFIFSDGDALFYNDTRQFGHIRLVTAAQSKTVFARIGLGPEPLSLSLKNFLKIIAGHPKKRAKDFLLNQSVIAGIGNIYADESLFMAKIHPLRKISTLTPAETALLLQSIQKVLKRAIRLGGSSIEYFLATNGTAGKFSEEHLVYAKKGRPCPDCGERLTSKVIGSRTSTFCIHCQI